MKNYNFTYVGLGDTWDKHEGNDGGFVIEWSCENIGFGTLTFIKKDGQVICDTETMNKEFCKQALEEFFMKVEIKNYSK